ncbi:uncharacterized protein [Emydura macquarii macquarii]|uniref:uncharacterized protein n=1 Tax=Emydura macquarii macquarii TaxID=1129001 RepID=UPI003529FF0A
MHKSRSGNQHPPGTKNKLQRRSRRRSQAMLNESSCLYPFFSPSRGACLLSPLLPHPCEDGPETRRSSTPRNSTVSHPPAPLVPPVIPPSAHSCGGGGAGLSLLQHPAPTLTPLPTFSCPALKCWVARGSRHGAAAGRGGERRGRAEQRRLRERASAGKAAVREGRREPGARGAAAAAAGLFGGGGRAACSRRLQFVSLVGERLCSRSLASPRFLAASNGLGSPGAKPPPPIPPSVLGSLPSCERAEARGAESRASPSRALLGGSPLLLPLAAPAPQPGRVCPGAAHTYSPPHFHAPELSKPARGNDTTPLLLHHHHQRPGLAEERQAPPAEHTEREKDFGGAGASEREAHRF